MKITIDGQISQGETAPEGQMKFAWQTCQAFINLLSPRLRPLCKLVKVSFIDYPLFRATLFQIVMRPFEFAVQRNVLQNTLKVGKMVDNNFRPESVFCIEEIWSGKTSGALTPEQKEAPELLFALKKKAKWHLSGLRCDLEKATEELNDLL